MSAEPLSNEHGAGPTVPGFADLDAWSNAVVAAALKMLWVRPRGGSDDVHRRLARAEALRNGRAHERRTAPVPERAGVIPFDATDRV